MDSKQKNRFLEVLTKVKNLFLGKKGKWKGSKVSIDLKDDAKPVQSRPYKIPQAHVKVFKEEIDRLVAIGLFTKVDLSEWSSPTFCIPKKDGRIRIVTDYRKVNKVIKRKAHPLPNIMDTIMSLGSFQYATCIDLNMGYYAMELDDVAKKICTIVLPWGFYQYNMLPMGVVVATDIFQSRLLDLLGDLEYVVVYLDDIMIIGNGTFEEHLHQVEVVLTRLLNAGMQVNPLKSFWFQEEVEYLGYRVTREGIKPQAKKIKKMLALNPPKNKTELRGFVGMVNYYRDMWQGRSSVLAPLTQMCGKNEKFEWNEQMQKAFEMVKTKISNEAMLAHPDFSEPFDVHTDSSDYQLGGVISQKGKPISFFSKKLNQAQKKYPITEKELLSITETLKEFRYLLLGNRITVYTDHKNLTHDDTKHTCDRVLRQRLLLEEYGCTLKYIEGEKNVVADTLSRLDFKADSNEICESYLIKYIYDDRIKVPVDLKFIAEQQRTNEEFMSAKEKYPERFKEETLNKDVKLQLYRKDEEDKKWLIYVPEKMSDDLIDWFHVNLIHPGESRLTETIRQNFYVRSLDKKVKAYVKSCKECQAAKVTAVQPVGKVPIRSERSGIPFEHVRIDCCGPWQIDVHCKKPKKVFRKEVHAATMIDDATTWPEIIQLEGKSAYHLAKKFDAQWLCRYPRPKAVVMDNGGEFVGREFQELLSSYGIKHEPTTVLNPRSNGIKERMHLTMADMLRTMKFTVADDKEGTWRTEVDAALQAIAWALRTTVSAGPKYSPANMALGRDMILNQEVKVNWEAIRKYRENKAQVDNTRENEKRREHDYEVGKKCWIVKNKFERERKLDKPAEGPFEILKVYQNGTVRLDRNGYEETINIRRLKPFYE